MHKCKRVKTPPSMADKLLVGIGTALTDEEATRYRSIIGGLQYLTLTRPDISFAINIVCQFLHAPTDLHMAAVKRILRYVQGTLNIGLKFHSASSLKPCVFSDGDWVGCPNYRCSTSSFAKYLGANLVSWSLRKQPTVSRSSTEVEYKALANAMAEIVWVQSVLKELDIKQPSILVLWCDNIKAKCLSANPTFHARMKHIEVDYHFQHRARCQVLLSTI
jgi:hypothetical protein